MQLGKREMSVCRRGFSQLLLVQAANKLTPEVEFKGLFCGNDFTITQAFFNFMQSNMQVNAHFYMEENSCNLKELPMLWRHFCQYVNFYLELFH